MTEKERKFVEKFGEMLEAAKEMEQEKNIDEVLFKVTVRSSNNYLRERQLIIHAIDGEFIKYGYLI